MIRQNDEQKILRDFWSQLETMTTVPYMWTRQVSNWLRITEVPISHLPLRSFKPMQNPSNYSYGHCKRKKLFLAHEAKICDSSWLDESIDAKNQSLLM